jgi:hypothetical protein
MANGGIKTALKVMAWVVGVFLALDLLIVGLLFVPAIQTFVVHKVTEAVSKNWGTELYIKDVHITPTLKLVAHEVAIKDHHNQNMIYSGTVKGRLRRIETSPFHLGLRDVVFDDLDIVLRTYKGEDSVNIAKWAAVFKTDEPTKIFKLTADKVEITDGRFVLINDNTRVVYDTAGRPDIDYAFFELADVNIKAKDFVLVNDDIGMDIKKLSFNQYGGFRLRDCSGDFHISRHDLTFTDLKMKTDQSDLDLDLYFRYKRWETYAEFLDSVRISAEIRPSVLAMEDVAGFAPNIRGMNEIIQLEADSVDGVVTDFRLQNVKALWNDRNLVRGDIAIRDVINFLDATFDVALDSSVVYMPDLAQFTLPGGKTIPSNAIFKKVGVTAVSGTFVGTLPHFYADLKTSSGLGKVNALLSTTSANGRLAFDGEVSSPDFNLAKLLNDSKTFGACNVDITFNGQTASTGFTANNLKTVQAHLDGNITRFPIMGYPLHHVHVEGDYQEGFYNASLTAHDPNMECEAIAQLDRTQEVPYLQGSISQLSLDAGTIGKILPLADTVNPEGVESVIAFLQRNPTLKLTFDQFQIAMHGNNLDNLNGFIGCDNLKLKYREDSLINDRLRLTTFNHERYHKYILSSNIANATFESTYPVASVKDSLQNIAHNLFPSLVSAAQSTYNYLNTDTLVTLSGNSDDYIKFSLNTYNTRSLSRLIFPDMFISPNSSVLLDIRADHSSDKIEVALPFFGIRNKLRVYNFHADGGTAEDKAMVLSVSGDSVIAFVGKGNLLFKNVNINANALNDNILCNIDWYNPFNSEGNNSNLSGSINISRANDIIIRLQPSKIFLKDYECHFNDENAIHLKPHTYQVDNLVFSTRGSSISLNGTYDTKDTSQLNMAAKSIDISLINPLLNGMSFGGFLSADLHLVNRNSRRLIYGKTISDEFVMNDARLGDFFLIAGIIGDNDLRFRGGMFNSQDTLLNYDYLTNYSIRDFQNEQDIIANISGTYGKNNFVAEATFDSLQAGFIEPFLSSFCDRFQGKASGKLVFRASPDSTYFDGTVHAEDLEMGIAALGTHYFVHDQDIFFNPKGIFFKEMELTDIDQNTATLSGSIYHNMFKDMRLDLRINTDRIMALNAPRTTNSVFYGIGYVKGDVHMFGDQDLLSFVGPNLTTLKGSKIVLQVSSANSVAETNYIQFQPKQSEESQETETSETASSMDLSFDFTFNVTNDADVVLQLESIGGTVNARTDGHFQLLYNKNDGINLFGNLLLHSGDVKINLFDVVNTKFIMYPGGNINFDGPLENMTVNLSAYKSSKTSLANIISDGSITSSVDVNAILHLNGPLMQNIEPSFSFELPNSSTEIRNMFYSAIDTLNIENLTKQFAYFMVTNTFMPENMFSGVGNGLSGMNLLSNMVNNVLSNVIDSKKASFGITYNQATEHTSAEYGLNANANLLNNRMIMSTRIGYYDDRTKTSAYNNIYGDISVEYYINEKGTWRVKAYTYIGERDDTYYYSGDNYNNYVAGVALTYKQDFDRIRKKKDKKSPSNNQNQTKSKSNKDGKQQK